MFSEKKITKQSLENLSPIGSIFCKYVEGALKAFSTKFDRDKLKVEISNFESLISNSEQILSTLESNLSNVDKEITTNENRYTELKKTCSDLEQSTKSSKGIIEIENKFLNESSSLEEEYCEKLKKTCKDKDEILANIIMKKTLSVYMARFPAQYRNELVRDTQEIVKSIKSPSLQSTEILSKLNVLTLSSDFCQHVRFLTDIRVVFCYDPIDIVKLLLSGSNYKTMNST